MKLWTIGGVAGAFSGLAGYLLLARNDAPRPVPPPVAATVAVASPACPPPPAVLPEVIELADLDPLLDPPSRPVAGAPFDEPPLAPAGATADPPFIPPAAEGSSAAVAPMPREVAAQPLIPAGS